MNIDEIKANTPEGATHINQSGYYFKDVKNESCKMYDPYNQVWFESYVSVFDDLKPL